MKRTIAFIQMRNAANNLAAGRGDGLDHEVARTLLTLANRLEHGVAFDRALQRQLDELVAALAEDQQADRRRATLEADRREYNTIVGETGRIKRLMEETRDEATFDRLERDLLENEDRMRALEAGHPELATEAADAEV